MKTSIVFVLGPGRSGTSLLTRVLSLSGCTLPDSLVPPDGGNPTGYWEPSEVVALNDQILRRCGSIWFDPTLSVHDRLTSDDQLREECIASIAEFLATIVKDIPIVLKDPRMSETLELWNAAAIRLKLTSGAILVARNPREFIKSVQAMGAESGYTAPAAFPMLLWLKYSLLAERCSRQMKRVVVAHKFLLKDWKLQRQRVSDALSLQLNASNDCLIDSLVSPALYRQRAGDDVTDPFPNTWLLRTFNALSAASNGGIIDNVTLDGIFSEFSSCEMVFRQSIAYFNSVIAPSRSA